MSLERSWPLALLVLPAFLLWLRLRSARPRLAEASSLLVWNKVSPSDTVPARPRPPLAAWLEAAGAALLAVGMAGPFVPGIASADPVVLLDRTPSMSTLRPGGKPRSAEATLAWDFSIAGIGAQLAGGKNVIVVTDHRHPDLPDDLPRLRTIGVGDPCFNAGITAAEGEVLPDGRWRVFLIVEAFGAKGPVEGSLELEGVASGITLQPGARLEILRDLEQPADRNLACRVSFPGDALAADDDVNLKVMGFTRISVSSKADRRAEPLVRALEAAGASWEVDPEERNVRVSSLWRSYAVVLPTRVGTDQVEGRTVVAMPHPLSEGVHVDPSVNLGLRGSETLSGVPVFADPHGALVTVADGSDKGPFKLGRVHFGFLPGGSWVERDPSFVVFAKNLFDYVDGRMRMEARGVLDPRETREAAEGETFGDLRTAIDEARKPDPASRTSLAFALLLAAGALLAAAWLAVR